jgi:hypothetical protein
MSKIIVSGFPHCGTSILKCIIGHIDDVEEIIEETNKIEKPTLKKFILCKCPFTNNIFFQDEFYESYIKIFIIRNPLFVFSSLNKRFSYDLHENHQVNDYIDTAKLFLKYSSKSYNNIFTIRYEDMFVNNYENLKKIFDKIGFVYTDDIFNNYNLKHLNQIYDGLPLLKEKPLNMHHELYRTWQINQSFVNNNNIDEIYLTQEQKDILLNHPDILYLYPDILDIWKNIYTNKVLNSLPPLCGEIIQTVSDNSSTV